jgi:hypothetical protein
MAFIVFLHKLKTVSTISDKKKALKCHLQISHNLFTSGLFFRDPFRDFFLNEYQVEEKKASFKLD